MSATLLPSELLLLPETTLPIKVSESAQILNPVTAHRPGVEGAGKRQQKIHDFTFRTGREDTGLSEAEVDGA